MSKRAINEYINKGEIWFAWRYTGKNKGNAADRLSVDVRQNRMFEGDLHEPLPVTPDGRDARDVFVKWINEWCASVRMMGEDCDCHSAGYLSYGALQRKLSELNLLPEEKPEPTIAERLADAEALLARLKTTLDEYRKART